MRYTHICNNTVIVYVFKYAILSLCQGTNKHLFFFWEVEINLGNRLWKVKNGQRDYLQSLIEHLMLDFLEWLSDLTRTLNYCCARMWAWEQHSSGDISTQEDRRQKHIYLMAGDASGCLVTILSHPWVLSEAHQKTTN